MAHSHDPVELLFESADTRRNMRVCLSCLGYFVPNFLLHTGLLPKEELPPALRVLYTTGTNRYYSVHLEYRLNELGELERFPAGANTLNIQSTRSFA